MANATDDTKEMNPAAFWKNAKLGYDSTIFEKEKQGVDSLRSNESFLKAAAHVYEMKNGESWEKHCRDKNIDPNSEAAKKLLGDYGIDTMRWFNNTTLSAADAIGSGDSSIATMYQLKKKETTNEQRAAFLYMMQAFEHTEGSFFSMGTVYGLGQGLTDATNLVGLGIGAFTGGAGTAAVQAARTAGQAGLKSLLVQSVKSMSMKSLATAGAEGAIAGGTQNYIEQNVQMQKLKSNGSTFQYQQDLDAKQVGTSAVWGFGFGAGLGATGKVLSDSFSWAAKKGFSPTTNVAQNNPTAPFIVTPYETWLHKIIKHDRFLWVNRHFIRWHGSYEGQKVTISINKDPHLNLPIRDLFSHKFLNPIIYHFDDQVKKSHLIEPIFNLRRELDDLRVQMKSAGDPNTVQALTNQVEKKVRDFSQNHGSKFLALKNDLRYLNDQVDELARRYDADIENKYKGGVGTGRAGLDIEQINTIKSWLSHANELCDVAQDPAAFLNKYNANRQVYSDLYPNNREKTAASITGAFQHYLLMAADADLRIKTRDYTGWAPAPFIRGRGVLASKLTIREKLLEKDLASGKITQAEFNYMTSPTFRSAISDGDDGFVAGGDFHHHKALLQNIFRLERELKDTYYNPHIRTRTMKNLAEGNDSPDNMENFGIVLTTLFEKHKKLGNGTPDNDKLAEEIAGKAFQSYECGREGDFFNSLRRLSMQQGMDGALYSVPQILGSRMKVMENQGFNTTGKDAHIRHFVDLIASIGPATNHSPEVHGRRHWAYIVEKYTRKAFAARLAPDASVLGVPGMIDYVKAPLQHMRSNLTATLTGAELISQPGKDALGRDVIEHSFKYHWWNPPPEKATKTERFWHELTARNSAITWMATPVTLPLRLMGQTKEFLNPVWHHTWRTFALAGGTFGLMAAGQSVYDLNNPDNKNHIIGDFGKTALSWQLWGMDKFVFGTPIRGSIYVGEKLFNHSLNTQLALGAYATGLYKPDPKKGLWDNLTPTFVDSNAIGSWAWNTPLPLGWLESSSAVPVAAAITPQTPEPPTPAATPPAVSQTQTPGQTSGQTPGTLTEQEKVQKTREELRMFGRAVASLTNAIADDGNWTEARKAEVTRLEDQGRTLGATLEKLKLGNYANDILKQAKETLTSQLLNNMTHDRPTRVPTFQEEEGRRQHSYGDKVRKWHDQVRALNLDVDEKGWNAQNKKIPEKLQAEHDTFASDVVFLRKDLQETDKRGLDMLKTLAGAAKADNPALSHVRKTDTPPEDPVAEQKRLDEKRKAEEAAEKAAQDKAAKDLLAKQKRDGTGGSQDDGKPGEDRSKSRPTKDVQKPKASELDRNHDGSEKGVGDHLGDWWNSFSEYTSTDGSSGSGGNSLGNAFGSAVSGGFSWLGNTYSHIKNKPGGGGRTLIRDVGAGIGAIVAASTLISPFWDKMWVGQIPIVGSLLKLGSVVVLFMLFRKGLNEMMDPAPPLEPAAGVMQQDSARAAERRSYLPRFGDGQTVHTQSHGGGTPSKSTVIYWDAADENAAKSIAIDMKAGKPVVQLRTDNGQTYISKGIVSQETVTQSAAQIKGNINVPFDRLNEYGGMARDLQFETVSHVGGDSFITKVGDKNHLFALDQGKTFADLTLER
ncbi:MAG: hypothetical protein KA155_02075 [Alphaproteobacteria bacterium]|jgi:hypothetical protein|nr:hypothetical protein [Alphaproteobacteria bacterium]